jgi:hypothetical protein
MDETPVRRFAVLNELPYDQLVEALPHRHGSERPFQDLASLFDEFAGFSLQTQSYSWACREIRVSVFCS